MLFNKIEVKDRKISPSLLFDQSLYSRGSRIVPIFSTPIEQIEKKIARRDEVANVKTLLFDVDMILNRLFHLLRINCLGLREGHSFTLSLSKKGPPVTEVREDTHTHRVSFDSRSTVGRLFWIEIQSWGPLRRQCELNSLQEALDMNKAFVRLMTLWTAAWMANPGVRFSFFESPETDQGLFCRLMLRLSFQEFAFPTLTGAMLS